MKTSNSRAKQQQPGKHSKYADRHVLKEITETEIDTWYGRTRASDIRSIEIQLVKLDDAARSKNLEALKEISHSSRGMVARMAKYALAVVSSDQAHKATRASSYALRKIFCLSGEYGLGWNLYLHRLRKDSAPPMIRNVGPAPKEVRQAHAQNK
jgi:hypothetical protein